MLNLLSIFFLLSYRFFIPLLDIRPEADIMFDKKALHKQEGFCGIISAATYFPTSFPMQYHRRGRT